MKQKKYRDHLRTLALVILIPGSCFPIIGKAQIPHLPAPMIRSEELRALPQKPQQSVTVVPEKTEPETKEENGQSTSNDPVSAAPDATDAPPVAQPTRPQDKDGDQRQGFNWDGAMKQSLYFNTLLHTFRLTLEADTLGELRGPFIKDYFRSVKNLRGWHDGDTAFTNYVGHPMQGAVAGRIQIHNDPKGNRQEFGLRKSYLKSRLKAMSWAALFSTQFELGPISEASLGNVGLKPREKSKHPMAFVDLVITPMVGTAWLVGEDMLDRFVVRRFEDKFSNRVARLLVRSFLNPTRSMANILRFKYPWHRDGRRL